MYDYFQASVDTEFNPYYDPIEYDRESRDVLFEKIIAAAPDEIRTPEDRVAWNRKLTEILQTHPH